MREIRGRLEGDWREIRGRYKGDIRESREIGGRLDGYIIENLKELDSIL